MAQAIESIRRRPTPPAQPGRVPPHNLQAEESLLGAMLLSKDAIASAVEICSIDDFYKPAHSHIYDAITSLYSQGESADPVTVADELRRADLLDAIGGPSILISLQSNTPAIANAARYARIVEEYALLRRLIGVASDIAEMGYAVPEDVTNVVDRAESMVFEVAQRRVTDTMMPLRDLLSQSLDRLEALYARGEAITGVPTGYVDLDERLAGLQPSNLLILGARPAMGKCVAWDTLMVDPECGARETVQEFYERGIRGGDVRVMSVGDDEQVRVRRPSAFVDDGIKPVYKVQTRLGREVRTTLSHPFLTTGGWRPLADLAVGARIGVPARLDIDGTQDVSDEEVCILAHIVANAAAGRDPATFLDSSVEALTDARRNAAALAAELVGSGPGFAPSKFRLVARQGRREALKRVLDRHDVGSADSIAVPPLVFELPRRQLAMFVHRLLGRLAVLEGAEPDDSLGRILVPLRSSALAADLQHLLLRFGIVARIRKKVIGAGGDRFPGAELEIARPEDIIAVADEISMLGQQVALDVVAAKAVAGRREYTASVFPRDTWHKVLQTKGSLTWREMADRIPGRPTVASGSRSTWRPEQTEVANERGRESAVFWDTIVSIEYDGDEQVYDLTVPEDHNFVANDVFVHNTSFALGIASHAAMEARTPVLFFSLEMSHLEITQRLLCAEARVDATRMRNGRLHESDWPKISHAIGRLGEAPIFIDDNPNVTIMDIRAKARRMKSREGLGLIIIDYLQLMSGRSNAENRQVEVSEMSRGLKILARELEVPVIALSQLSRNLETRADKRPVLADLRESGSLEQDADVVMFLYRDEIYNPESADRGTAEIIVSKHRNGPTGSTQLAFLDHYTRFANMARV